MGLDHSSIVVYNLNGGETMSSNHQRLRSKTTQIHRRLLEAYGEPSWRPHLDAVSELVSTILSQNTNDVNRDVAFERLRDRLPTWEEVRDAETEVVIEAIRPAGLANQKGPRIQEALRFITEEQGELSLNFLADLPVEDAKRWLTSMNGVGPKTAACVLLFSLHKPALPVDTHVHRVALRVGLLPEKTGAAKAHSLLEDLLPPELYYPFHLNMIRHGRTLCSARDPQCDECPLQEVCAFALEQRTPVPE